MVPERRCEMCCWAQQANAAGRYHHPTIVSSTKSIRPFAAGAATCSDFPRASGALRPSSREPSSARDGRMMAPRQFWVVARGINIGLNTRMYFCDEQEANLRPSGAESD